MKKLSVIIPAYNAHDTLPAALASIVMQYMRDDIVVYIVDDASEFSYDKITEAFQELIEVHLIRLDLNGGPALARQIALDNVSTPYVAFLDADDIFMGQSHYEMMIQEMEERGADLVCGDFLEMTEENQRVGHANDDIWFFGKIYKMELIRKYHMVIPIISQNEDTAFNALYHIYCKLIIHYNHIVYHWNFQKNSITRIHDGVYATKCFNGLVENLITIYSLIDVEVVGEDHLLHHLANRVIRFYGLALTYYEEYGEEVLVNYLSKVRRFYDIILINYEDKITNQIYNYEWQYLPNTSYPIFGFKDFLKSLPSGELII